MTKPIKDPYHIVADALQINKAELNVTSCMGETPNWDSLNHIGVICAIEAALDINIDDKDIIHYSEMETILKLFEEQA